MATAEPPTPAEAKRTLRERMNAVTRQIAVDAAERQRRSAELCERLIAAVVEAAATRSIERIMVYDALMSEPDLTSFTDWCAGRGIALFRPGVDGPDLTVVPGDIDPRTLDALVVPGRAFTADGRRLGRGGGHYDRFLARLSPQCLRLAVAYQEQLVTDLPVEEHDTGVDRVITDSGPLAPC